MYGAKMGDLKKIYLYFDMAKSENFQAAGPNALIEKKQNLKLSLYMSLRWTGIAQSV